MSNTITSQLLKELEAEAGPTRKCLQNIPAEAYDWQPHPKSMKMSYLAQIVAEIPRWIHTMIVEKELDFVRFPHPNPTTTEAMVAYFDENMELARKALQSMTDEQLQDPFTLKADGHEIMTTPKFDNIAPSLNHWVHHRGQLTVYMRIKDIPVPAIYGPSGDDKGF
jgi:uncharacterized damage-inducible protein DinB